MIRLLDKSAVFVEGSQRSQLCGHQTDGIVTPENNKLMEHPINLLDVLVRVLSITSQDVNWEISSI